MTVAMALEYAAKAELELLVVAVSRDNWRAVGDALAPLQVYSVTQPFPVFVLVPRDEPEALLRAFELRCADCSWLPIEPVEVKARLNALVQRRRVAVAHAAEAKKVWRVATVDAVTGLYNRYQLERALPKAIESAQRGERMLSVLMADIDGLKAFNDRRGHPAGDLALRMVGEAIRSVLRPGDTVARYGGDEMAVILPDTPACEAEAIASAIVNAVADLGLGLDGGADLVSPLTLSVGAATLRGPECRAKSLLARADEALYRAKRQGRNRAVAA